MKTSAKRGSATMLPEMKSWIGRKVMRMSVSAMVSPWELAPLMAAKWKCSSSNSPCELASASRQSK